MSCSDLWNKTKAAKYVSNAELFSTAPLTFINVKYYEGKYPQRAGGTARVAFTPAADTRYAGYLARATNECILHISCAPHISSRELKPAGHNTLDTLQTTTSLYTTIRWYGEDGKACNVRTVPRKDMKKHDVDVSEEHGLVFQGNSNPFADVMTTDGQTSLDKLMLSGDTSAPDALVWTPSTGLMAAYSLFGGDFRLQLAQLRPGTGLYDLADGTGRRVGSLSLVEPFVASRYADHQLHFGCETETVPVSPQTVAMLCTLKLANDQSIDTYNTVFWDPIVRYLLFPNFYAFIFATIANTTSEQLHPRISILLTIFIFLLDFLGIAPFTAELRTWTMWLSTLDDETQDWNRKSADSIEARINSLGGPNGHDPDIAATLDLFQNRSFTILVRQLTAHNPKAARVLYDQLTSNKAAAAKVKDMRMVLAWHRTVRSCVYYLAFFLIALNVVMTRLYKTIFRFRPTSGNVRASGVQYLGNVINVVLCLVAPTTTTTHAAFPHTTTTTPILPPPPPPPPPAPPPQPPAAASESPSSASARQAGGPCPAPPPPPPSPSIVIGAVTV